MTKVKVEKAPCGAWYCWFVGRTINVGRKIKSKFGDIFRFKKGLWIRVKDCKVIEEAE